MPVYRQCACHHDAEDKHQYAKLLRPTGYDTSSLMLGLDEGP